MLQIEKLPEFDNHKFVANLLDKKQGLHGFIAIHRGNTNLPSFGATRFWHYNSQEAALEDALRLSRLMSYKAAMAGLSYGGAKGVIMSPKSSIEPREKQKILEAYAKQVNRLNGRFITGTDVGINQKELMIMKKNSRFMVGIRSNPTKFTALGLFSAIEVCLQEFFGKKEISGHSFAIQGVGKIGLGLLRLLYPHGANIFISDINIKKLRAAKKEFPQIKIKQPSEIQKQKVDCFVPCALSNVVNMTTLSQFRCKIIAGGANNQLENSRVGRLLHNQGILYAPDYIVNAGGLISVVDEYEHKGHQQKRVSRRIAIIPKNLRKILKSSKRSNNPPFEIANAMAENIFNKY